MVTMKLPLEKATGDGNRMSIGKLLWDDSKTQWSAIDTNEEVEGTFVSDNI